MDHKQSMKGRRRTRGQGGGERKGGEPALHPQGAPREGPPRRTHGRGAGALHEPGCRTAQVSSGQTRGDALGTDDPSPQRTCPPPFPPGPTAAVLASALA